MDISVPLKFYGYGYGYAEFSWILPMESPSYAAGTAATPKFIHQTDIYEKRLHGKFCWN
jgi:hypothetical protein